MVRVLFFNDRYSYKCQGLFRDDIISENDPVIQEALKRLSDKEAFDRTFRLRRAIQLNLNHDTLPTSEQTKPEEVKIFQVIIVKFKFLFCLGCSLPLETC